MMLILVSLEKRDLDKGQAVSILHFMSSKFPFFVSNIAKRTIFSFDISDVEILDPEDSSEKPIGRYFLMISSPSSFVFDLAVFQIFSKIWT